ncbi:MAG: hypothetical protein ACR2L1_02600 [Pyrinomonadaceae bacterium]
MKIINIKLIAICLVIVGLVTIAQAQIDYRTNIGGSSNFAFNFLLPSPPNKYRANADKFRQVSSLRQIFEMTDKKAGLLIRLFHYLS